MSSSLKERKGCQRSHPPSQQKSVFTTGLQLVHVCASVHHGLSRAATGSDIAVVQEVPPPLQVPRKKHSQMLTSACVKEKLVNGPTQVSHCHGNGLRPPWRQSTGGVGGGGVQQTVEPPGSMSRTGSVYKSVSDTHTHTPSLPREPVPPPSDGCLWLQVVGDPPPGSASIIHPGDQEPGLRTFWTRTFTGARFCWSCWFCWFCRSEPDSRLL